MRRSCKCNAVEEIYQKWPTEGKLKDNMNLTLEELKERLKNESGEVYSYVVTTVKYRNGEFLQTGSAPNFQGNLITLCTCKHLMRTWKGVSEWKGIWIAGFTSMGLNYLFYLMKVSEAYPSHKALWENLPEEARKVKNARYNPCGDVYEPKPNIKNEFDPSQYYEPIKNHLHAKRCKPAKCKRNECPWHKDINYIDRRTKRRPALLVGDPTFSFLWSRPMIYFKYKHPRQKVFRNIRSFILSLEEV